MDDSPAGTQAIGGKVSRVGVGLTMDAVEIHDSNASASFSSSGEERINWAAVRDRVRAIAELRVA